MITELVEQISDDINKKKDLWFLETMEKHNLISSNDLSNFDLYFLSAEMGVRIVTLPDRKQIFVNDKLIGEWFEKYEMEKEVDRYTYKLKFNYWN